ncbi:unnamed protein product [Dibothriocephalus latus]|uniref:Uncharacterized protein n=1 Tax=Dibothriocephalus latus TaxID=60516 RepID=A0A3P7P358_DIBLA|nr:unnamed protein product [Dibothriocephalus latus]
MTNHQGGGTGGGRRGQQGRHEIGTAEPEEAIADNRADKMRERQSSSYNQPKRRRCDLVDCGVQRRAVNAGDATL